MFLADSLNEKLKHSLSQFDMINSNKIKPKYSPRPQNPKILHYHPHPFGDENSNLNNVNFEKNFSLYKLHKKWDRKWNLNFDKNYRKFSLDCISEKAKNSKSFIKDLLDPDLFESKKPKWNISNKANEKFRTSLKKNVFEFMNGLNEFPIVALKEKNIPEGVDSRDEPTSDKIINWKISSQLNEQEIKELNNKEREKDFYNTQKYWKKNKNNREKGEVFKVSQERKKIEEPRYFKPYKDPKTLTSYYYNTMNKVKENLWIEREKIEKKVKNEIPESEKFKEKVDYLVNKKMYNEYKEQFDIMIGKKKEKKIDNRKQYNWKDEEIVDKIETISDWKDIKWFRPDNKIMSDKNKKVELLKCLVKDSYNIKKEEDKIKEEIEESKRKKSRLELIRKKSGKSKNLNQTIFLSKYPVDKKAHDFNMRIYQNNFPHSNSALNILSHKEKIENEKINENEKEIFLEAYKKVVIKDEKKKKKRSLSGIIKNKFIEYHYYHPGVYRGFIEKKIKDLSPKNENQEFSTNKKKKKLEEEYFAWSCCLNRDRFSKGCSCEVTKKRRWNYDIP